jgi:RNA polymerase sigma factor (sigma-70 family)
VPVTTNNCPAGRRLNGEQVTHFFSSAANGDAHGWGALVREFSGLIRAIARAHGLGEADIADVAQATWLRLLEHLHDLHDPSRVGAWLATTSRRECLRILRDAKRQVLLGDDTADCESPEAPPGDRLMVAERDLALWRSFARLRARDQALLRLLIADHRPDYEEISAVLAMPIGSIGPTRARALERLRLQLEIDQTLNLVSV